MTAAAKKPRLMWSACPQLTVQKDHLWRSQISGKPLTQPHGGGFVSE